MIVRRNDSSLLLITQPDHAALAAQIMAAWQGEALAERPTRAAALFATEVHDVGWTGFDAAPMIDGSGRPVDFMEAPASVKQEVWRQALQQLPQQSSYAAALIAQHALTVLKRFRNDREWTAFFAEMEDERDRWFTTEVRPDGSSGGAIDPPADARLWFLLDYAALHMGDLLSLTFCNGWTELRSAEGYDILLQDGELRVSPDPFGGRRVPLRVRAKRLPDEPFQNADDMRLRLAATPFEHLEGVAVGVEELTLPANGIRIESGNASASGR